MEPPQYNGGLLVLQKREYLAKRKSLDAMGQCLYLIFKPSVLEFKEPVRGGY